MCVFCGIVGPLQYLVLLSTSVLLVIFLCNCLYFFSCRKLLFREFFPLYYVSLHIGRVVRLFLVCLANAADKDTIRYDTEIALETGRDLPVQSSA